LDNLTLKKDYVNINIAVREEIFDLAMSVFQDYDFCGIEEGTDMLTATFESEIFEKLNMQELLTSLQLYDKSAKIISIDKISDRNWNEEWEKHIEPVIVSPKITITPTHRLQDTNADIKIVIDPKMSFGTGHHTTTRLMCQLMEGVVQAGSNWIDVGTGTGVLAILAVRLGADDVYAFDNNEWSIENALENIGKNNVGSKIILEQADIDSVTLPACNGIAANIFLNLAVPSMKKFRKSIEDKDGDLLVSGIMIYDEKLLLTAAKEAGLKLINTLYDDEWAAFHFKCEV
jgi:ribosomal protein L11 methyltransferase